MKALAVTPVTANALQKSGFWIKTRFHTYISSFCNVCAVNLATCLRILPTEMRDLTCRISIVSPSAVLLMYIIYDKGWRFVDNRLEVFGNVFLYFLDWGVHHIDNRSDSTPYLCNLGNMYYFGHLLKFSLRMRGFWIAGRIGANLIFCFLKIRC